jgi:hypothetical protein
VQDDDYHRETETRQQIIRIFLIISTFFVTFSEGDVRKELGIIFAQFLIFAILYYILLTRSKNTFFINFFGILSSYAYSLLFIVFISTQLGDTLAPLNLIAIFFLLLIVVTFALLAPNTSERIHHKARSVVQSLTPRQKTTLKWVTRVLVLIFLIFTFIIGYDTIKI